MSTYRFHAVVDDDGSVHYQVRAELERNLSDFDLRQFYRFLLSSGVTIDFGEVLLDLIAAYETVGMKKGDAEIGAFCEWRQIDLIVSYNRDFLRGLASQASFEVMSPQEFCEIAGI